MPFFLAPVIAFLKSSIVATISTAASIGISAFSVIQGIRANIRAREARKPVEERGLIIANRSVPLPSPNHIYGRMRQGGDVFYRAVVNNNDLILGIVLSKGPCEKIEGVFIGDEYVELPTRQLRQEAGGGHLLLPAQGSDYWGTGTPQNIQVFEYFSADGTQGTQWLSAGSESGVDGDTTPTTRRYYTERPYTDEDGAVVTPSVFHTIPQDDTEWRLDPDDDGNYQTSDPEAFEPFIENRPPFTAAHQLELKGYSYVFVRLHQPPYQQKEDPSYKKRFWTGTPPITFLIQGKKIAWPGQTTPAFTKNAVAHFYDYCVNIAGIPASKFRLGAATVRGSFAAAFAECERMVDFTSNAKVTAPYQVFERTFKAYGEYGTTVPEAATFGGQVSEFLTMMGFGNVTVENGEICIYPGKDEASSGTIEARHLIGLGEVDPWPALSERNNSVTMRLLQVSDYAQNAWREMALPPFIDTAAVARDGGEQLSTDFQFDFAAPALLTGRLGAIATKKFRETLYWQGPVFNPDRSHFNYYPGQVIQLTHPPSGMVSEPLRIEGRVVKQDDSIEFLLAEDQANTHADDLLLPPLPVRQLRFPTDVAPDLTGLKAKEVADAAQDGSTVVNLIVECDEAAVHLSEFRIRKAATTMPAAEAGEWRAQVVEDLAKVTFANVPFRKGDVIDVWGRHHSLLGNTVSDWAKITHTLTADLTPPDLPTNVTLTRVLGRGVRINCTPSTSPDSDGFLIFLKSVDKDATAPAAPIEGEAHYAHQAGREANWWMSDISLEEDKDYYAWIVAVDKSGNRTSPIATAPTHITASIANLVPEGSTIWTPNELTPVPADLEENVDPTDTNLPDAVLNDLYIRADGTVFRKSMDTGGWIQTALDLTGPAGARVVAIDALEENTLPPAPNDDPDDQIPDNLPLGSIAITEDGRVYLWDVPEGQDDPVWTLEGDVTGPAGPALHTAVSRTDQCGFLRCRVYPPRAADGQTGDIAISDSGDYGRKTATGWPTTREGNLQIAAFGNIAEQDYRPIVLISDSFRPRPEELVAAGLRVFVIQDNPRIESISGIKGNPIFVGGDGRFGIRANGQWIRNALDLCSGEIGMGGRLPATPNIVDAIPTTTVKDMLGRDGKLVLRWRDSGDDSITSFQYRMKTRAETHYGVFATVPAITGVEPYDVTGVVISTLPGGAALVNGTVYDLELQAVNATGGSLVASAQGTPTADFPNPATPYQVVGEEGDNSVNFRWGRTFDPLVTGFRYKLWPSSAGLMPDEPSAWTTVPGGAAAMRFAANLTMTTESTPRAIANGTRYRFDIQAIAVKGSVTKYSATATAFVTPGAFVKPAKPEGLSATPGNGFVDLAWSQYLAVDIPRIDRVEFQRKLTSDTAWPEGATPLPVGAVTTRTHRDLTAMNDTPYDYRIRTVDGYLQTGEQTSDWSDIASATPTSSSAALPAAPTMAAWVRSGTNQLTTTWKASSDSTLTGHKLIIEKQDTGESEWTVAKTITGISATATHYHLDTTDSDIARPSGVASRFIRARLVAVNDRGDSPQTPVDTAPSYITGEFGGSVSTMSVPLVGTVRHGGYLVDVRTVAGNQKITIHWQASQDPNLTQYSYHRELPTQGSDSPVVKTATSAEVDNLTNGTTYEYSVRGWYGGVGGPGVRVRGVPSGTAETNTPAQPQNLALSTADRVVGLSWTALGDATVDKWQFRRKDGAGSYGQWTDIAGSGPNTTSHRVVVPANGVSYCFQVRAVNEHGDGVSSLEKCATPAQSVPAKTTGLVVTPGESGVALTWTRHSDTSVTSYDGRARRVGSATWGNWQRVSASRTDVTGEIGSLANGVPYQFQVAAVNAAGRGEASDIETGTPVAGRVELTAPALTYTITYIAHAATPQWQIRMVIGAVTGATGYQYRYRIGPSGNWRGWTSRGVSFAQRVISINTVGFATGQTVFWEARAVTLTRTGDTGAAQVVLEFPKPLAPTIALGSPTSDAINFTLTPASEPTGYPAITSYEYQTRVTGGSWPSAWTALSGGTAAGTRRVSGLTTGTQYDVRVRAVSSGRIVGLREGDESNVITGVAG